MFTYSIVSLTHTLKEEEEEDRKKYRYRRGGKGRGGGGGDGGETVRKKSSRWCDHSHASA